MAGRSRGERLSVIVRRFGEWRLKNYPHTAEQEWAALTALARVGAPTPRPIWLDASGSVFGCPTIVAGRLPGRGLLAPRDLDGWVRQLAEALASIHAAPLHAEELGVLVDQREEVARLVERDGPPAEIADRPLGPEVWAMMRRWWPRIEPAETGLVHGDFWPGNTLWRYGRLTGVIDWEQVRRGDPAQDVGCCRLDLALLFGPATADAFLTAYQAASGRTPRHLFFWELFIVTMALENVEHWLEGYHDLGRTDVTSELGRARLERFVTEALARAADDDTNGR
jgi:aminoglycoside phosphotransferase (APT) family kinase protein